MVTQQTAKLLTAMKHPGFTLKYFQCYLHLVFHGIHTLSGKNSEVMRVNFSVSICFYLEFYATKIAKLAENLNS